jgi:hypothetical protein
MDFSPSARLILISAAVWLLGLLRLLPVLPSEGSFLAVGCHTDRIAGGLGSLLALIDRRPADRSLIRSEYRLSL